MTTSTRHGYHHGDLHRVLRVAAAALLAERGAAGFSLREVARRADVSHAAPAHHFGDARGLLTAVAVDGFAALTAATTAAAAGTDDPVERLVRVGRAYVEVAVTNPGHCAVMFRHDLVDTADSAYQAAGREAYGVLVEALRRIAERHDPELDVDAAAITCWAAAQGLLDLQPNLAVAGDGVGPAGTLGDLAELVTRMIATGLVPRSG